ncbi:glycoprotein-N-acetylgalactosamine 3-beta-galactosyltransferase 1 [Patella vulgata]|uniref:glycoprotein-N-acetylgalactosamine 3-beta-galactosyltransferase 1 n=1 Tax=Patella vulgata TaxID=6465 RepID=UPI0021801439|nr:glycoprotein-N-acetylgalactosamine 3-beta-galactosyltransferase 1 [Patella vulgata]
MMTIRPARLKRLILLLFGFTVVLFILGSIYGSSWQLEKRTENLAIRSTNEIKVLCVVLATLNEQSRLNAVNDTWVRHCDKHLFVMTDENDSHDVLSVDFPEGRTYLTDKVVYAFKYIHDNLLNDFDWFVKADDDTYMVIENLKYILSHYREEGPAYLGGHIKMYAPNGYMAGGCGYVLNRQALRMLIKGYQKPGLCRLTGGAEDLETGRCLAKMSVPLISSVDKYDKETFNVSPLWDYVKGHIRLWVHQYLRNNKRVGQISKFTISFHKVDPEFMRLIHFILNNMEVAKPEMKRNNYFNLVKVPPIEDLSKEEVFLTYFYESVESYKDIEAWRKKNNTVLVHQSPHRTV